MKILVLNCGSSSVKYKLIDTSSDAVLAEGGAEKIGLADGFLKYKKADGSKAIIELGQTDHNGAVKQFSTSSPILLKDASRIMLRSML